MFLYLLAQSEIRLLEPNSYVILNANIFLGDSILERGTIIVRDGRIVSVGKNVKIPKDVLVLDYSGKFVYPGFIEILRETSKDNSKEIKNLRNLGFTIAQIIDNDSILRGFTKVIKLKSDSIRSNIILDSSFFVISFQTYKDKYPVSLMGTIAYIRQFLYDQNIKNVIFLSNGNELNVLRSYKIINEFKLNSLIYGTNKEFRIVDGLEKNLNLILPLEFIDSLSENPTLNELLNWKFSRENARILSEYGFIFALSTKNIKSQEKFLKNLRELAKRIDENKIILSLTLIPAKMLNIYRDYGSIEKGKIANFTITDGNIFDSNSSLFEVWIDGVIYRISKYPRKFFGIWKVQLNDSVFKVEILNQNNKLKVKLNGKEVKAEFKNYVLTLDNKYKLYFSDEGCLNCEFLDFQERKPVEKLKDLPKYPKLYEPYPKYKRVLIKNAIVWLADTILENVDILIEDGKFSKISKNIDEKNAFTIYLEGKHITPGIFDAHSHIAIDGGVNEYSESIVPEVRVADVINPFDINIYRELAGGVTTAHIMHGSANPIGGQNVIIKLKFGFLDDSLIYTHSPRTIKFALGENPKRSNWYEESQRYPKSRLGVIGIIEDALIKAINYTGKKNLRIEALRDILEGKVQIHCHAYRQDEMLALMESLRKFNIQVRMFHHALEAYKIAKELKKYNVHITTFSDWWSYKIETYDAIPYNAIITKKYDVLTSLNSDSPELARRLNTEASKMIKYGNLKETDALKLITLNPAKQFGIDKYIGSIEVGKDADFVIWSSNPLSPYSIVLETWIEGRKFFDREDDIKRMEMLKNLKRELLDEYYKSN